MKGITVFIPTFNNQTTLSTTLESLESQKCKHIKNVIIMDDGSTDTTVNLAKNYAENSKYSVKVVENKTKLGLGEKYNKIIYSVGTDYLLLMHADIKILNADAVETFYKRINNPSVAVCVCYVTHSFDDWIKYSFWQKIEFDRKIKRKLQGINGKFDMFSVRHLKQIKGFDSKSFFRAGEDWDMFFRIKKVGKIGKTSSRYLHQHSFDPNYGLSKLIHKHAMYSQAAAVVFRKHYQQFSLSLVILTFFREFMALFILFSIGLYLFTNSYFVLIPSIILLLVYLVTYAKNTYIHEAKNPRILLVPFVLLYLLLVSNIYTINGLVFGKQTV